MRHLRAGATRGTTKHAFLAVIVFCAGVGIACGGGGNDTGSNSDRTPTSPTPAPVPAASIQLDGDGRITNCVQSNAVVRCEFQETGRNAGPGCATSVRITIRFLAGETEIGTDRWSLGSARVLMPGEEFIYMVRVDAPREVVASITQYNRQAEWTNTRC